MTLNKLTNDIQPLSEVDKINEIIDSVNSISIPSVGNGIVSFTQNGQQKGSFSANQSSNTTIDFDLSSRNIGEIVASTIPLTDAGLHLLDGALISDSGVYSAFVTYIAGLRTQYSSLFTTESDWQSAVTQYGVCGKFVYNSTNNTVRLPKYSDKIYTQELNTTAPVVGNGISLGLTDGTTNYGLSNYKNGTQNTASYYPGVYGHAVSSSAISNVGTQPGNHIGLGVTSDPTKSGLIAQLSNITTSLDGYYYIVIATSTKTDIQVDIDNIATDLNGKADIDLTNTTNQAKILMSGMGMPSDKYVDLTLGASDSLYTAPANGWLAFAKTANAAGQYITLANITNSLVIAFNAHASNNIPNTFIPCAKGDTIRVGYNLNGATQLFRFIYAVGSESEAL